MGISKERIRYHTARVVAQTLTKVWLAANFGCDDWPTYVKEDTTVSYTKSDKGIYKVVVNLGGERSITFHWDTKMDDAGFRQATTSDDITEEEMSTIASLMIDYFSHGINHLKTV